MAAKKSEKIKSRPEGRLDLPAYYQNRELSWLAFNKRVLGEARDRSLPLFERIKFLAITSSNLDEFFMIRVASLKDQILAGYKKKDMAGMTPAMQLEALGAAIGELVDLQYSSWNRSLLPALREAGFSLLRRQEDLTEAEAAFVDAYFQEQVYPVLTPMAVDSSRPFPLVRNKSLNLGALVSKKDGDGELEFAMVQVPGILPRVLRLQGGGQGRYILLEEIIRRNMRKLFLNYQIICCHAFRIMRNGDLSIREEEASDLLLEIEKQLKSRQWGQVIRLEVEKGMDKRLLAILQQEWDMEVEYIYAIDGPLDLGFLMKAYGLEGFEDYKNPPFVPFPHPDLPPGTDIFAAIRAKDILLSHPFQSFEPVVDFVRQAARDEKVLAIKQTLYRVSGDSPIIKALAQAAENGKQVTVLVELKARFDEENNILWARKLEKAGCHVIYGLVGLKTHSKITLVVRREEEGIRRYVHLGTGNYNDSTAKLYTDIGLFTCRLAIGEDATAVFNMLSGYSEPLMWNKLSLAPLWLKDKFLHLIGREEEHARAGRPALIWAKMNSLCDPDIIQALYKANGAGVEIRLIIRGICTLRTGIEGISDHIEVRSIVGNFLEHSRIFYFGNDGQPEVYCASADWMPRNLDRRVEILFPIEEPGLRRRLEDMLQSQWEDNQKSHVLQPDGSYKKVDGRGHGAHDSQMLAVSAAREEAQFLKSGGAASRVFVPLVRNAQERE